MFKSIRKLFNTAIQFSKTNVEQTRTTYILKRKHEVRLSKMGSDKLKKLRRRNFYYEEVECLSHNKVPIMDILLLKNVTGIGNMGDIIQINITRAYEYFIITGAGLPATPENIKKYAGRKQSDAIPINVQNLMKKLERTVVPVFLNDENNWTLQKWHIKLALRRVGILCNEDCIKLPEKEISGPNVALENRDFAITLTINKKYDVLMRCRIFQTSFSDPNAMMMILNKSFYLDPIQAIFPEDQEMLEKIPVPNDGPSEYYLIYD